LGTIRKSYSYRNLNMPESEIRLRVSVVGLFIDAGEVLLIHQTTPPEPDCWDLPGGGLEPGETLLAGLMREVREETGLDDFQVEGLLTIAEDFFPTERGGVLHTLNIIYKCSLNQRPTTLKSDDPEVGEKGIQWVPLAELNPRSCSTRSWKALQTLGMIKP
jgi:8-oxo-dGTP diphosphatase